MQQDPFDLLGLPPAFDLDPAAVQRAYLRQSAALHPDHAAAAPDPEAEARAAALNQAKGTLEDPERRAEALLRRVGGPSREADRSLPPAFLAEIMSIREQIEADLASGEADKRDHWEDWASERRSGHIATVAGLFAQLKDPAAGAEGHGGGGEEIRRRIRQELNVWRYTERLLEHLDSDGGPPPA